MVLQVRGRFRGLEVAVELTDYPPILRVEFLSVSDQLGKALASGSLESGVALVCRLFRAWSRSWAHRSLGLLEYRVAPYLDWLVRRSVLQGVDQVPVTRERIDASSGH